MQVHYNRSFDIMRAFHRCPREGAALNALPLIYQTISPLRLVCIHGVNSH